MSLDMATRFKERLVKLLAKGKTSYGKNELVLLVEREWGSFIHDEYRETLAASMQQTFRQHGASIIGGTANSSNADGGNDE